MKKLINYFTTFEWALILGLIFMNAVTGGITDALGAICSISGILAVVLIKKGKISNYIFGLIKVVIYIYLAYTWRLYGEVMLNGLIYLPAQFIGFYLWNKNIDKETGSVMTRKMTKKQLAILVAGCAIAIVGYARVLIYLGGNSVYLDSTTNVLSIVAQVLMLAMFTEQWILWILVNLISMIMWVIPALTGDSAAIAMVIMWAGYTINSIAGYVEWNNMNKK